MNPRPEDERRTTWLSLSDASRLLGVSTATVRRWADSGRLPVYTTPGGHRRFSRTALERILPGGDRARANDLVETGLTPARLSRAYRRSAAAPVGRETAWLATLDADDRDAFRRLGRQLAWELVAHLDADEPEAREHHLAEATAVAVEYGRRGGELGLSMSDVVEGFLAFRRPFLAEVGAAAERRGLQAADVNDAHDAADQALDRLLVATMSGHRARAAARRGPSARPRSAP
jgi:excisionase family DNA binding protein